MLNVTVATFSGSRFVTTTRLWQHDYGQVLVIEGIELPETFEVHFGNQIHGKSKTRLGHNYTVNIPDEYLTHVGAVYAWIFLHAGADDGETEYQIKIPIEPRARPVNDPPTPIQQDVITQTIAALNDGVERAEIAAESAEEAAQAFPPGGTTGQVLAKKSDKDHDAEWVAPESGTLPAGGIRGQVLVKQSATPGDAAWEDLPKYDGSYEVTPLPLMDTVMQTQQTYLDRDVVVKAIPYQKTTNQSGGYTATIGG